MVDGKARLIRDDYCDGLGDCLPACPAGAITFTEREAPAYDKTTVLANKTGASPKTLPAAASVSGLSQWPIQIKLVRILSKEGLLSASLLTCSTRGSCSKAMRRAAIFPFCFFKCLHITTISFDLYIFLFRFFQLSELSILYICYEDRYEIHKNNKYILEEFKLWRLL